MTNEEMFNSNIKIAYKIAWQYQNCGVDIEDLKQICLLGLWKAVLTFNKKHSFSTYAYPVIINEVNYYLRKNRKYFTDRSFSEPTGTGDITLEETIADERDRIKEAETKIEINNLIQQLKQSKVSENEKKVFELHMKGLKQRRIAEIIGCSQPQVSRYLTRIKGKLGTSL